MKIVKGRGRRLAIISTEILTLALIIYLVALPFYPTIKFKLFPPKAVQLTELAGLSATSTGQLPYIGPAGKLPVSSEKPIEKQGNRIIISKIGVNSPIIESNNEQFGLNHGAWHMPNTGDPIKQGNMVITGHRFKYLPPNNLTFFLLDKVVAGDIIQIVWDSKIYNYEVFGSKIVPATEISILAQTEVPILTVFSCDPIYSTENRLVVLAKPVN